MKRTESAAYIYICHTWVEILLTKYTKVANFRKLNSVVHTFLYEICFLNSFYLYLKGLDPRMHVNFILNFVNFVLCSREKGGTC